MMLDSTPIIDGLPKSFYEAKQLVSKLGLGVKRIDCCVKGCMLFYDNEFGVKDGHLVECKFCQDPRYKGSKHSIKQGKTRSKKGIVLLTYYTKTTEDVCINANCRENDLAFSKQRKKK